MERIEKTFYSFLNRPFWSFFSKGFISTLVKGSVVCWLVLAGHGSLLAQSKLGFNLTPNTSPTDESEFDNQGVNWDFRYDPCTGELHFAFLMFESGNLTEELEELNFAVVRKGDNRSRFRYSFGHEDGYRTVGTSTSRSVFMSYNDSEISNLNFWTHTVSSFWGDDDFALVEFTYTLKEDEFVDDLDINFYAEWDNGRNIIRDVNASPPSAPVIAPNVTRNSGDNPSFKISWEVGSVCEGMTGSEGAFLELVRKEGSSEKVLVSRRFDNNAPYDDVHNATTNPLDECTDYEYFLRVKMVDGSNEYRFDESPSSAPLSFIDIIEAPDNFQASDNSCDGSITLTWDWDQTNPLGFVIFRKLSTESEFTQLAEVEGGVETYVDDIELALHNTTVEYQIGTRNACGITLEADRSTTTGVAPEALEAPTEVKISSFSNGPSKGVRLTWNDNSDSETKYIITRQFKTGGGLVNIEVAANATSYDDLNVTNCVAYLYTVKVANDCAPNGVNNEDEVVGITIDTDLSEVIEAGALVASRGYFKDRVVLNWTVGGESQAISRYRIFGRPLGSTDLPVLIGTVDGQERTFEDTKVEAGEVLEYFLTAEADCGEGVLKTNDNDQVQLSTTGVATAVGFRSPEGVINGNIAYTGGNGVKDVKVIVESASGSLGHSLELDGTDLVRIADSDSRLSPDTDELSISLFIKPDFGSFPESSASLLSKEDNYRLLIGADGTVTFGIYQAGEWQELQSPADYLITEAEFTNINATYDGNQLLLYFNGEQVAAKALVGAVADDNTNELQLGENYAGLLDELSIWKIARAETDIARDYARLLNQEEPGMLGYWPINLGQANTIYDASKTGNNFHGADGDIVGAEWSEVIPDTEQLSTIGYTDEKGNYTISGIRYAGVGENFNVTPVFGVHQFSPSQKVIFIGDGNLVQNGVDFEDISSFRVTGQVVFEFADNSAGSEGVRILIDGQPVVSSSGQLVTTDANGLFEIQVPIGEHYITVEKPDHQFKEEGRFPTDPDDLFNFNEPLTGLEFLDITKRKLVGRVVGGTREGDKPVGFQKSVNNIGQAKFVLRSTDQKISVEVATDATTGEYEVALPPKVYQVVDPILDEIGKIRIIQENITIPASTSQVDLFSEFEPDTDTDTVVIADNVPLPPNVVRIDTVDNSTREVREFAYDAKVNFVHRTSPQVFVYDGRYKSPQSRFLGEKTIEITTADGELTDLPIIDETLIGQSDVTDDELFVLGFPTLLTDRDYKLIIAVNEIYTNQDSGSPVEDKVPVTDADITIDNDMMAPFYLNASGRATAYSSNPELTRLVLNSADGDTLIRFKALKPEFNDNSNPETSFTREFKITVNAGGNSVSWPNPADDTEVQRVYVFGNERTDNTTFVTRGPDVVDYIIRDPYGGESYAYLEKGQTLAISKTFTNSNAVALGISGKVSYGSDDNNFGVTAGFQSEDSRDSVGNFTSEITTTERLETRSDATEVGEGSDLYISSATNYQAGVAQVLGLIDESSCTVDGIVECLPSSRSIEKDGKTYKLGRSYGTFLSPDTVSTYFVFTQNHIINTLIPDLINTRNTILLNNDHYVSHLTADHEYFGSNNDAIHWGEAGNNPLTYDTPKKCKDCTEPQPDDRTGPSYTFTAGDDKEEDSVAWINQQIRLWEDAIKRNEREKLEAYQGGVFNNVSISGGARISRERTTSETTSTEVTYGTSSSFSAGFETKVSFTVAIELAGNLDITQSSSTGIVRDTTSSTTYGYELYDPDGGDFLSMNIYDGTNGSGPIFILNGGETACPHEEAVTTQYFAPGTLIGSSTLQKDKPRLDVEVSELFNVPADGQAAFRFTLFNDSESQDDFIYSLQVIDESNPNGAVVNIDDSEVFVPGGGAVNKVITMERGPFAYDYEDIKIVMASTCQSDPTDLEKVIADTVSISAYFLPICTTPEIESPNDNWTLNNRFDNKMTVQIGDFDINFPGFEYLELQYKSSESSSWIPIQQFYRDLDASGNPAGGIEIPRTGSSFSYEWDVSQILDGNYDLRVISDCEVLATGGRVEAESGIKSGIIDRINPHVFGSPQPADGILSPGDEISVQFNEPINTALLSPANFSIRGVLNGGDLGHNVSVGFDGTGNESVLIANPPNMQRSEVTIDFWARRNSQGAAVILHQGATAERMLQIGFDAEDKVYIEMNGQRFTTQIAVTGNAWTHYSFGYDYAQSEMTVTVASGASSTTETRENFDIEHEVNEPVLLGQSSIGDPRPFNGNLHELRIWGKLLSESETAVNRNLLLNASTSGLLANWPFDEATGSIALDIVKVRQATVNAGWALEPSGKAMTFDGTDDYLESNGIGAFTEEQGFTIELWFKTDSDAAQTLFSNGKGDDTDDNESDWAINLIQGQLNIESNGQSLDLDLDLADGTWHHLALAVNRTTNVQLFVDGELRKSASSDGFGALANDLFWYGRRSWTNGGGQQSDQHFDGLLDEFRLWSTVRSQDEIRFNRYNNLNGDEIGLVLYYPFEAYVEQAGVLVSSESNASQVAEAGAVASFTSFAAFDNDVPPIRLPRPLQAVNFNYSANGDQIILTTNEDNDRLENVVLNIGVKNIRDLNGNLLDAPITWTAFVDRNDVVWLDDELSFDKPVNEPFTFTTSITNTGGQIRNYQISNLPFWLMAFPASGQIEPTRSVDIEFTINEGLNIGTYNELIHLTTEFGFDEKLSLEVNVFQSPPETWTVDPQDFQSSMSVVGQIEISGILSRDKNDLIAAFVDNECRGVANLQYFSAFDNYQSFLSIYTNVGEAEEVIYKIWDASEGKVYTGLEVSVEGVKTLSADGYYGEPANPVTFSGSDFIEQNIAVQPGWQWVSFNLASADLADVNLVFQDFEATENDQIKGFNFFDQYDPVNGWIGTLSANGGFQNERMYKLNTAGSGRIAYAGSRLDAPSNPIDLTAGWNWLGFYGQQNQDVNEALANMTNLTVGDRIKGQLEFAVYGGQGVGWVGSLGSLKPGEGYMLLTQGAGTLTYPEVTGLLEGTFSGNANNGSETLTHHDYQVKPGDHESNMNLIIRLEGDWNPDDAHILVTADGQAVGWGDARLIDDEWLFFVTVHGNQPETLSFELVRPGERMALTPAFDQPYLFSRNGTLGSLNAPEVFMLPEAEVLPESQASPNPFNQELVVRWAGSEPPRAVHLVTMSGETVRELAEPEGQGHTFSTGNLAQGVYLLRLAFANRVEVIKVMKTR